MLKYLFLLSKNFILFLLIFLLQFNYNGFSQTSINEKVEINPDQFISHSPKIINDHTFTYSMTWPPSSTSRANIQIILCSGDTLNSGWSLSGSTTISFPANSHFYLFQPQSYFYKEGQGWGWWESSISGQFLEVYIDDINLNHPQNILGSFDGVFGTYQFEINDLRCENGTIVINPSVYSECNQPNWYYNDEVNIQITDGAAYFTFYDTLTSTDLGTITQIPYVDIPNIIL